MVLQSLSRGAVLASLLSLVNLAAAHPKVSEAVLKRAEINITQIQESYDYIVVGGGQAGVVIANRLTENPDVTVLVIEYGYFNNAPSVLEPTSATRWVKNVQYNITSVPQVGLNGYKQDVYAACCVGGGSTINGMMLNRGSAADYDSWEALGNPGWGFNGLYPYFIKSSQFDPPAPQTIEEFNITWGEKSYGDGPIHQRFSSFQWPGSKVQVKGIIEAGAEYQVDGSDGHAYGVFWYPTALDNKTVTRSYAVSGYWDPVKDTRKGFNILTGWRVDEVVFDDKKHATGILMTERELKPSGNVKPKISVKATKEIIIAAGALHSPQVLQRSGIGPKGLLAAAGIPVVVDLPGVGSNLQDHAVATTGYKFNTNVWPNPEESMNNASFAKWAEDEYATRRGGPMAVATGNIGGLIPLPVVDPEGYKAIVESYLAQDLKTVLPANYTPEQVAGYSVQRRELAALMSASDNAFLELPLQASGQYITVLIKGLSRGTVLLDPKNIYGEPIVDYHTFFNPADASMLASSMRFVRKFHQTPSMKTLSPVEVKPGANITSDADMIAFLKTVTSCSTAHNSGTCTMMPRELGGVVGVDLLVYGVTGLSVADSSIMPIIPGAHICSTVYAIAEKAADIIKSRHNV